MSELDDPKTTTAEVREFYSYGCGPRPTWEESQAEFDVWLAAHDAEVEWSAAAKAMTDAAEQFATQDGNEALMFAHDDVSAVQATEKWLRARSAAYRREETE